MNQNKRLIDCKLWLLWIPLILLFNLYSFVGHSTESPSKSYTVAYNETTAFLIPLVKAVYKEIGVNAVFILVPSERAITGANLKQYDADLSRVDGSLTNYQNLIFTNEPLKKTELLPFAKKGSRIRIQNVQELRKHTIGYSLGSKLPELFVAQHKLNTQIANSETSLYAMLDKERFEILLITDTQLTKLGVETLSSIVQVGPALESSHSFHVLNKKHIDLIPKFDRALRKIKSDGRYNQLIKK